MLTQRAIDTFLRTADRLENGRLELEMMDGKCYYFEGKRPGPHAHLKLHCNNVIANMALRGNVGFAEDYRVGKWESRDLTALVEYGLINQNQAEKFILGSRLQQLLSNVGYLFSANSRKGSRKNIHAHYDIGNSFYALWLDPGMTYSSAIFKSRKDSLETAQANKYDRILDRLDINSKSILEIGCGWGGFAERSVEKCDCRVKGVTVSAAQHAYAQQRLADKSAQAELCLEDYRDIKGRHDAIVSIEMFEAVGQRYWKTYFGKLKSLLHNQGKALIQTITIADEHFKQYQASSDAIRSHIFPGGMLPSPERFSTEAQNAGLRITDRFFFGQDYASTLQCWLKAFEQNLDAVRALNLDEPFIRLWRFYLAACIAGFRTGRTNVMQVEMCHAD